MKKLCLIIVLILASPALTQARTTVNCVSSPADTTALQAAINGPDHDIYIPGPSQCLIGPINATGKNGLTIEGDGAQSVILPYGAGGTIFDLTGSEDVTFKNLKISAFNTPDYLFKWLTTLNTTALTGLYFDHVNITAATTKAHLYAYGFAGLHIRNSRWTQLHNGAPNSDFSKLTSVVKVDANNGDGVTSAYSSVGSGQSAAVYLTIENSELIDGAGPNSNNALLIGVTAGQMEVRSTRLLGAGVTDVVLWNYAEGNQFYNADFDIYSGGAQGVQYFLVFGGGLVGNTTLINPFFSIPRNAFLALAPPIGSNGGISQLVVQNNDIGGNMGAPFIGLTFTPPGSSLMANWIDGGDIDVQGQPIVTAGGITNQTVIRRKASVSVPSGASDGSISFPAGYTPPPPPAPPPGSTTWNAADKNGGLTLSNGNLTISNDGRTTHELVRANVGMQTGKFYWEITTSGLGVSSVDMIGVQDSSASTADGNYVGVSGDGGSLGYSTTGASFYLSGFTSQGSPTPPGNQVWRFAYDADAGKLWIGNSAGWLSGDPAAGTSPSLTMTTPGTKVYPAVSLYATVATVTANFGSYAYSFTPPSGFGNVH